MFRMILAAAVAFALASATPARACGDCDEYRPHKNHVSAADKADKKDAETKASCACADGKDCKCGASCQCAHCAAKKAEKDKKESGKKS